MRPVAVLTMLFAFLAGLMPSSQALAPEDTGCDGLLLMADPIDPPVATGRCPGVRPGAWVRTDRGGCSFNFVFSGSDGRTYIGTAGHCIIPVPPAVDERTWAPGTGPTARDSSGRVVGRFVYAVMDGIRFHDFALVQVADGIEANPAMCHWGGPTSMYTEQEAGPILMRHYGNGVGAGNTIPARSAIALDTYRPDDIRTFGAAVWGDSGSGIMTADGAAAGVIVRLRFGDGTNGSSRIAPQIERAADALGLSFELRTAPLAE